MLVLINNIYPRAEIVHLSILIEKLFNETEAIEILVNNGSINNTHNWGWSNGYNIGEKYPPQFDAEHMSHLKGHFVS